MFVVMLYSLFLMSCEKKMISMNSKLYFWEMMDYWQLSMSYTMFNAEFIFLVSAVSFSVVTYSKYYMEGYNNKKFSSLTTTFYLMMVLLIVSSSWMILLMGWEGLGISSLFLIMFYPNKMSMSNSIMTMTFNRFGDVLMMIAMVQSLSIYSMGWQNMPESISTMAIISLMTCSMTKSAQYPLSSWLPAAMSAPTPISAMVHSSTLVTAGVMIIYKLYYLVEESSIMNTFLMLSSVTFLLGGFMSLMEKDLKKIVAFSTMSQVSMIMIWVSSKDIDMGMAHLVNHAGFKSFLFMFVGMLFVTNLSIQHSSSHKTTNTEKWTTFGTFMSCFSMMGITFSSSFYSKDTYLEMIMEKSSESMFLVTLAGSAMTVMYCSKIMSLIKSGKVMMKLLALKESSFMELSLMMIMLLMVAPKFLYDIKGPNSINASFSGVMLILFAMISCVMIFSVKNNSNLMQKLSISVSFMKKVTYSEMSGILKSTNSKFYGIGDKIFMKSNYISMNKWNLLITKNMSMYSNWIVLIIFLC